MAEEDELIVLSGDSDSVTSEREKTVAEKDMELLDTGNLQQDLIRRFKLILLCPKVYFANFPLDEPVQTPAIVYGVTIAAPLVVTLLSSITHPAALGINLAVAVGGYCWFFAVCAVMRFTAGILGGTGNLPDLMRASVYANVPTILNFIPIINYFAWLYSLALLMLAVERVEELEGTRAMMVVGAAAVTTLIVGVIVGFSFGLLKAVGH